MSLLNVNADPQYHQNKLAKQQYLVLNQLVAPDLLQVVTDYLWFKHQTGDMIPNQQKNTYNLSHEPVLDVVLDYFSLIIRQVTGLNLAPSYSYARIYYKGADLNRHVDRSACEFSFTLPLSYSDDSNWPLYVAADEQDLKGKAINLMLGDALIYQGPQLYHWREPLDKDWQAQIFLHFISLDGDHAKWQFDQRDGLRMSLKQLHLVDDDDLDIGVIGERLSAFLKKQLVILRLLRGFKKSLIPLFLTAVLVSVWLLVTAI